MIKKRIIESVSKKSKRFSPSKIFRENAHIKSFEEYLKLYQESIENPDLFWAKQAEELDWFKKWDKVSSWKKTKLECKWFEGGKINISYNCLDRHLDSRGNKTALIWEPEVGKAKKYTYKELHKVVCRFSNVLKKYGVKKGDRVCFYMPMIPELTIGMLACVRLGAIHSVVFGGFSIESLKDRIIDSKAKILITSNASLRKGKSIPMKNNVDAILGDCKSLKKVVVVKRADDIDTFMKKGRDVWWHKEVDSNNIDDFCKAKEIDSEHPAFILYTSGTTGKPKGVVHSTAGYLMYTYLTFKYVFDYKEEDIFWCTADIGWITGHSYIVYGPLANGATTIMFEGVPTYPNPDRYWEIVDKYKVSVFYTAPTVVRALERFGKKWVEKHDLSSLRLLGSVGEPINPDAWMWYHQVIGKGKCPIVDTWWQTETGGILITPLPGAVDLKPGSACFPFFGVKASVLTEEGQKAKKGEGGYLVIEKPWPSMLRTVYKNPKRFKDTYFNKFPGMYFTNDGVKCDEDGYFWIMGRMDDVVNVSGHRLSTAEVEGALVSHGSVTEAAVVPMPHKIKGSALYAFVTLKKGLSGGIDLISELRNHVGFEIGPIAKPDRIQFTNELPKTRSGKIMRRILKAIAAGKEDVGNTMTLANPEVVKKLKKERLPL
ncbi:acetate--CoA ligase [Candidatus Woesearchaeota archaeon]|nr:acetate--CoA ligase [Candidatus Woesearchaeota archaeon]MBL7050578.1 acetate--CoA ligase [Candidatus Woesearchaeota archaeon]